jgi:4-methylaminobutanoate oxidase (formaldehyde-forming)
METFEVIIIGGGVLGASVAYHLASRTSGKVLVLDRHPVAQGNSSLAAGLLTRGRLKPHLIPLVLETYRAIDDIQNLTGLDLDLHQTGCLYIAESSVHSKGIVELAAVSKQAGLKVEQLDPADAAQMLPWLSVSPESTVFFMPDDGIIDGYTLTIGYLKAARQCGAEVREGTAVFDLLKEGLRVNGVSTDQGIITAGIVVDAAGVWAGRLALDSGIPLPMAAVRSHYWMTAPSREISPRQPFVLLPDARAYARPDTHRLLFGFREARSVAVPPDELPEKMDGYAFRQDPNGWESLLEGVPELAQFIPLVEEVEISSYVRGLSNYTPDGNLVVGAYPGVDGFLTATGCSGAGLAVSGGMGRLVADLALGETPFVDPDPHRPDRFGEIDPLSPVFLELCKEARSGKITG